MLNLVFLFIFSIPIGIASGIYALLSNGKENMSPRMKTFRTIANLTIPVILLFLVMTISAIVYLWYNGVPYHLLK